MPYSLLRTRYQSHSKIVSTGGDDVGVDEEVWVLLTPVVGRDVEGVA